MKKPFWKCIWAGLFLSFFGVHLHIRSMQRVWKMIKVLLKNLLLNFCQESAKNSTKGICRILDENWVFSFWTLCIKIHFLVYLRFSFGPILTHNCSFFRSIFIHFRFVFCPFLVNFYIVFQVHSVPFLVHFQPISGPFQTNFRSILASISYWNLFSIHFLPFPNNDFKLVEKFGAQKCQNRGKVLFQLVFGSIVNRQEKKGSHWKVVWCVKLVVHFKYKRGLHLQ